MLTRDEQRIAWMKEMPCIICLILHGKQADLSNCQAEPHHIPADGMGKVAKKTSDYRTIPLCRSHHNEVHWIGKHSFQAKYSVDFEYLIREFNRIWEEKNADVRSRPGKKGKHNKNLQGVCQGQGRSKTKSYG